MTLIAITITLIYLALIGSLVVGFDRVPTFALKDLKPVTKFSVIVPFRNEQKHLEGLLGSIARLNYPKNMYEVIFVDDESTDDSLNIIVKASQNPGNIKPIKNNRTTGSPKKDAISTAMAQAKYDWIITTDADCELPKFWLDSYDGYLQQHDAEFIAGPVLYSETKTVLGEFQTLDMLSLQGTAIGSFGLKFPFLCNGANLAYTKKMFDVVEGFKGNENIGSGDDIFMLEKVLQTCPEKIGYLKCKKAIVATKPQPSMAALVSQRIRWAAKTKAYNNLFGKLTGIFVFLMNSSILVFSLLAFAGLIKLQVLLCIIFIKLGIDFLLIYRAAQFMEQTSSMKHYLISCIMYPFFVAYVTFASVFIGYKWKGRRYGQ